MIVRPNLPFESAGTQITVHYVSNSNEILLSAILLPCTRVRSEAADWILCREMQVDCMGLLIRTLAGREWSHIHHQLVILDVLDNVRPAIECPRKNGNRWESLERIVGVRMDQDWNGTGEQSARDDWSEIEFNALHRPWTVHCFYPLSNENATSQIWSRREIVLAWLM